MTKHHALPAILAVVALVALLLPASGHSQSFADSVKWRIYVYAVDSIDVSTLTVLRSARFAFHPDANYGPPYDVLTGFSDRWTEIAASGDTEMAWPPAPPGLSIWFQNPRSPTLGSLQRTMIHPYTGPAQVDTFRLILHSSSIDGESAGANSNNVLFWPKPSVLKLYADSIILQDKFNSFAHVDMTKDSNFIYNPATSGWDITSTIMYVIVYHPKPAPLPPDTVGVWHPLSGETDMATSDSIKWIFLPAIDGYSYMYRIQVATDKTFKPGSIVLHDSIAGNSVRYTLPAGKWYHWRVQAFSPFGVSPLPASLDSFYISTVNGVGGDNARLPAEYSLRQNYPDPFNPATTIRYQLPSESKVSLRIYNVLGLKVATLVDGVEANGYKAVVWEASDFASGVYFFRLDASSTREPFKSFSQTRKMVLIK